jgi:hypothetical protein
MLLHRCLLSVAQPPPRLTAGVVDVFDGGRRACMCRGHGGSPPLLARLARGGRRSLHCVGDTPFAYMGCLKRWANLWVQATPDYAFCVLLHQCPGAPDPGR